MNKKLTITTGICLSVYSYILLLEAGLMAMCGSICSNWLQLLFLAVLGFGVFQWMMFVLSIVLKQSWLQIVLIVVPPIFILASFITMILIQ